MSLPFAAPPPAPVMPPILHPTVLTTPYLPPDPPVLDDDETLQRSSRHFTRHLSLRTEHVPEGSETIYSPTREVYHLQMGDIHFQPDPETLVVRIGNFILRGVRDRNNGWAAYFGPNSRYNFWASIETGPDPELRAATMATLSAVGRIRRIVEAGVSLRKVLVMTSSRVMIRELATRVDENIASNWHYHGWREPKYEHLMALNYQIDQLVAALGEGQPSFRFWFASKAKLQDANNLASTALQQPPPLQPEPLQLVWMPAYDPELEYPV